MFALVNLLNRIDMSAFNKSTTSRRRETPIDEKTMSIEYPGTDILFILIKTVKLD